MNTKKRRLIIVFSSLVVFITILFVMFFLNIFRSSPVKKDHALTPTPVTKTEKEKKIINNVKDQIITALPKDFYNVVNIRTENNWAIASLEPKDKNYEPGNVILKRENNVWNVILGPGTSFEEDELVNIGAPEMIIREANNIIVTTPEPL